MTDTPDERPRPTPRPAAQRPAPPGRPSPRPRVAGSRRDRDEAAAPAAASSTPAPRPSARKAPAGATSRSDAGDQAAGSRPSRTRAAASASAYMSSSAAAADGAGRRISGLVLVLALLCTLRRGGSGLPALAATESQPRRHLGPQRHPQRRPGALRLRLPRLRGERGPEARRAHRRTPGAVRDRPVLGRHPGDLRAGLGDHQLRGRRRGAARINEAQDNATLVVFGQYVVESPPPARKRRRGARSAR